MSGADILKSRIKVGPLYPVLVDSRGEVIDGFHRLEADPSWPREAVPWVEDEYGRRVARIHANVVRRAVSEEERAREVRELAELLAKQGLKPGEIGPRLARDLPFTHSWIARLLPDKYKAKKGPEAKPELAGEVRMGVEEPAVRSRRVRRERFEDWNCPLCNGLIRIYGTVRRVEPVASEEGS